MGGLEICLYAVERLDQFLANHHHFGLDQVDAVFEYLASLGGIEHGAGDAEFGCAGYYGQ